MRYIVRKEGLSWTVRGDCGHFYAGRKTHADAINWANTLAYGPMKRRAAIELARAAQALKRMENRS